MRLNAHGASKNLATPGVFDAQGTSAAYSANGAFPLREMPDPLTVDESTFQKPKSRSFALVAYKLSADVGAKLALFVITVVAARRLSAVEFGVLSLGMTLGWMAAVGADFGTQMHLARAVARGPQRAAALLSRWLRVRLCTAAAAIVIVAIGTGATRPRLDVAAPILLLTVVYAVSGLVEFLHYFYRGLSRTDLESAITAAQRTATLVCCLAVLFWRPSVTALGLAMLVPALAAFAWSLGIAGAVGGGDGAATAVPVAREFVRDVMPIGAGIVLSALYFRIDVLLVELWAGTEAVARYNAVFRIVEALRLFPAAALAVALPALCRARDLRPLVRLSTSIAAASAAAAVPLWFAAGWIVPTLFGPHYVSAVPAFRILLLSLPLLSLNYALTHQVIGWDGQRAYAVVCAVALVGNVLLNARLIPMWSIDGAAWATLGTELIVTAGCVVALLGARASLVTRDFSPAERETMVAG